MSSEGPEFNPVMQADEPLTPFDVSRSSQRVGLLKLVIGFGLLLIIAFIALKIYQPGVRDRGDPPLITADNTPFKIVPEDPGGMQTPDQDKEVFDVMGGEAPSTDVTILPPPEDPIDLPDPAGTMDASTQPAEIEDPVGTDSSFEPLAPQSQPQAQPEPERTQPQTERVETPAPTSQPATVSDWVVQVASLRSQAEAETTFAGIRSSQSAILSSYSSDIARVDLGDRGIYYRARVVGFASRGEADETCTRLKAAGQSCFVTRR